MKNDIHLDHSLIRTLHSVFSRLNSESKKGTSGFMNSGDEAGRLDPKLRDIPILPLENLVPYPFLVFPLLVDLSQSVKLVEDALQGNRLIGLVSIKDNPIKDPKRVETYEVGTLAKIHDGVGLPDNTLQVVVEGLERFRVESWLKKKPYLSACISLAPDFFEPGLELDALKQTLSNLAEDVFSISSKSSEEMADFLHEIKDPKFLTYFVTINAHIEVAKGQQILEMDGLKEKMRALISHLTREREILSLGEKIRTEASGKIMKAQREYYLREQLKAIQKELGETDESQPAIAEYKQRIKQAGMSEEAKKQAQGELKRLSMMPPHSAEYPLIQTYLDWLLDLPWNALSDDQLDVHKARVILDKDHYELKEVKDRLIEYLAVRRLIKERDIKNESAEEGGCNAPMGTILCLVGPPGVGKTSLGQSISHAMGRKFTHMSLGGIRDEAEIRGHRRTYIGAMPGRIIQAIKRASTRNPVFMLDEVDKIGKDWRGDPSSALLEVLDPTQNHAFRDHYLDVDFDLSDVIFITTANQIETIPAPLHDRMEILRLDGYTDYEKIRIAQDYLVPRQVKANGLRVEEIVFTEDAIQKIVQDYTREAGVRNLERHIGAICRKSAVRVSALGLDHVVITSRIVREYLKREKFESESSESIAIPGIATGLAVTEVGGDILFIEATHMPGDGELKITGQLGDVMTESAQIAYSYVRSKAGRLDIDTKQFVETNLHIHVPAGAIPKDGPSAGLAMVVAIASLFSGRLVHNDIGMTGEITLRGRVLPVGSIKMKVLAANRAGLTTVLIPKRNILDLDELPQNVRKAMTFVPVEWIDDALKVALQPNRYTPKPIETMPPNRPVSRPEVSVDRTMITFSQA